MKCEDCIHYEVCSDGYEHIFGNEHQDKVETVCETFKGKSRFIELPCKVGDKVYLVYSASGIQEWEVTKMVVENSDRILLKLGHQGTDDFNMAFPHEFGECVFFTKEEAEKRAKELKG